LVPYNTSFILETVAASIGDAVGLDDTPALASDNLKDLGLSRLRLLAVCIELEDKFAIEFPPDAIDGFRVVDDVASYIQSREMTPYDDESDELPVTYGHSVEPRSSIRDRLQSWPVRRLGRVVSDVLAMIGSGREPHAEESGLQTAFPR
jgi:acyl carrier protein